MVGGKYVTFADAGVKHMMHGLGGVCGGDAAGKHHKLIIEEEPWLVISQLAVKATLIAKLHYNKSQPIWQ